MPEHKNSFTSNGRSPLLAAAVSLSGTRKNEKGKKAVHCRSSIELWRWLSRGHGAASAAAAASATATAQVVVAAA